jgi:hypothetical protein
LGSLKKKRTRSSLLQSCAKLFSGVLSVSTHENGSPISVFWSSSGRASRIVLLTGGVMLSATGFALGQGVGAVAQVVGLLVVVHGFP